MINANYWGKSPDITVSVKRFEYGIPPPFWKTISYTKSDGTSEILLAPFSSTVEGLYVPGDLFVDGSIISPSDINLKTNIKLMDVNITDKLMNLKPSSFSFKDDLSNNIHYGFVANEFENEYPELVQTKPDKKFSKLKSVNYLEIIPLLVHKIQLMQKEIDELKNIIVTSKI